MIYPDDLPDFLQHSSWESIPLASRSTLDKALGKVSAGYSRLVVSIQSQMVLSRVDALAVLAFYQAASEGKASFQASFIQRRWGLSHHMLRFEKAPELSWHSRHLATVSLPVRVVGRVNHESLDFNVCQHCLLNHTRVRELSSQVSMEHLSGWISHTRHRYGKQYAVEVTLKLSQKGLKAFLNWHQNELAGGSGAFAVHELGELDPRLNQKRAIWASGLRAQAQGEWTIIEGIWWVSHEI